ncbi:MAG: iron-sulfur cluster assembly scaffold protein [Proteobacteria bacterium]|nr:MAG: iron-sulfur cluster assembly scaffold protein [Pseudomonadota bacterium]
MSLVQFAVLFLFLVGFVSVWYLFNYFFGPRMDDPDGYARVAGNCGDTMEIGFKVEQGRITRTHHWTDGCSVSGQCVESAARLALDKKPEELEKITMISIMDQVGQLPDTHLHCAQLAETTLHKALADYRKKETLSVK